MRKLLLVLAATFALTAGTTAFATPSLEYNSSGNSADVSGAGDYTTVVITKGDTPFSSSSSASDIVYINQFESGALTSLTSFLIKAEPTNGNYTALFGGASGASNYSTTFRIGDYSKTETPMDKLEPEATGYGYYKVGFKLENISLDGYDVITVKIGDKIGGYDLHDVFGSVTGAVNLNLGLQIDNVPQEYVGVIQVYLGSRGDDTLDGRAGTDPSLWNADAE